MLCYAVLPRTNSFDSSPPECVRTLLHRCLCSDLGSKVDRFSPGNTNTSLNPGLAELRRKMGLCTFPAEEVLDSLYSTAASDGKLTRSVRHYHDGMRDPNVPNAWDDSRKVNS